MLSNSVKLNGGKGPDYICKVRKIYPGAGSITTIYAYFKQERVLKELRVFSDKTGERHVPGKWEQMKNVEPVRFLEVMGTHSANGSLKYARLLNGN